MKYYFANIAGGTPLPLTKGGENQIKSYFNITPSHESRQSNMLNLYLPSYYQYMGVTVPDNIETNRTSTRIELVIC